MNNNFKKMWPAAAASLVFFTSLANAANGSSQSTDMRNGSSQSADTRPLRYGGSGPKPEINPPARPVVRDGMNLFASGEFLWWKAVQDDLEYVATIKNGVSNCANNRVNNNQTSDRLMRSIQSSEHAPDFQYCPGFRVGLGYNSPRDGWDVLVNWTRLHSSANDKRCAFPCDRTSSATCPPACVTTGAEIAAEAALGSCCVTGNDCGQCNQCCTKCTSCYCDPCTCNNKCSKNNPCNGCNKCCEFDCDCCCEPCPPCCDVCFNCGCPEDFFPLFAPVSVADQFRQGCAAAAHWRLRLNLLDGELGREFFVSRHLTLRPFMGVRGAWIKQKLDANYEGTTSSYIPYALLYSDTTAAQGGGLVLQQPTGSFCGTVCSGNTFNNDFEGVGPRFGFNSEWMIGGGVSLYADAAISLLWGKFNVKAESNLQLCGDGFLNIQPESGSSAPIENNTICVNECFKFEHKNDFHSTKAVNDLGLGVQWQGTFAQDRVGLLIKLGWEQHIFFDQNQIDYIHQLLVMNPSIPMPVPCEVNPRTLGFAKAVQASQQPITGLTQKRRGDLTTQGLTVSARLDF